MIISPEIAQSIVDETSKVIHHNVNFMNHEGRIVASIDKKRIGDFHEGAWQVLLTKQPVIIESDFVFQGAKQGINLPVYFDHIIIGVIGITGSVDEIGQLGAIIKKMTEIMVKEAYYENKLQLQIRAKESFVGEWLEGQWDDDKLFASRGWILGIDVYLPRIVILLDFTDFNDVVYKKLRDHEANLTGEVEIQRFRKHILLSLNQLITHSQDIIIPWGNQRYILLKTISKEEDSTYQEDKITILLEQMAQTVLEQHGITLVAGIGRYHESHKGVYVSFKDASKALYFAKKHKNQHKRFYFYEHLGIESFINELSMESRMDFVNRILTFDSETDRTELLKNMEVFFEANQSISVAADQLYIHKNTLQYRLRKIKEQTGYDPRVFHEAVLLYVALLFQQVE